MKYLILPLILLAISVSGQSLLPNPSTVTATTINQALGGAIAASGTNTYTGSLTGLTTYNGFAADIQFAHKNTSTSCSLNINSLGAKSLKKYTSSGVPVDLDTGDIKDGSRIRFYFNGTYLVMMGGTGGGSSATAPGSDKQVILNSSGAFGASSQFTYDITNNRTLIGSGNTNNQGTDNFVWGLNSAINKGSWSWVFGEENSINLTSGSSGFGDNAIMSGYQNQINNTSSNPFVGTFETAIGGGYDNVSNDATQGWMSGGNHNRLTLCRSCVTLGGEWGEASGYGAFAHGLQDQAGHAITPAPTQRVLASGKNAFNFSINNNWQTVGRGATAERSTILNTKNGNVACIGCASIGGYNLNVSSSYDSGTVAVSHLAIMLKPTRNDALYQILARDSVTGKVGFIKKSSISGGGGTDPTAIHQGSNTATSDFDFDDSSTGAHNFSIGANTKFNDLTIYANGTGAIATVGDMAIQSSSGQIQLTGNSMNINSTTGININNKLSLMASTTSEAPLKIPHGTAPTSPSNGDVWTTTSGLFARINGATVGPYGPPEYVWSEIFDDDPSLSGGQTDGKTKSFTLAHTPISISSVSINGVSLDDDQYSLSSNVVTITDRNIKLLNTSSITRSGTTATVVLAYQYSGISVGNVVTVSGASNSALNGTYYVTSVTNGGNTFTYTTSTSGTISAVTNASISLYAPPSKKSKVKINYLYSSAQSAPTRYATGNINNVVFYGNSLFWGVGSEHDISDVVSQIRQMLPTVPFRVVNLGTPGITTGALDAAYTEALAPQLSTSYAKNIIVVSEIVNDNATNPTSTATDLFNHYKTLCNHIKSLNASYIVIACTVLSAGTMDDTKRQAVNNMIIADNSFYDYLINTTANTAIGTSTAYQNTTYFNLDGLHLFPEGYFEWAKAMYPSIMTATGITAQDISALAPLTSNNKVVRNGGNYNLASDTTNVIGAARHNNLNFVTYNTNRGHISKDGQWTINPKIIGTNPIGLKISPSLGDDGMSTSTALVVQARNNRTNPLDQINIKSSNGYSQFKTHDLPISSGHGAGLFDIRADSSQITARNIVLPNEIDDLSTPTTGMINFSSVTDATRQSVYIGKYGGDLHYNTSVFQEHKFKHDGQVTFTVGATNSIYGPYSATYVITGQGDNPVSTPAGLVFRGLGGGSTGEVLIVRNYSNGLLYKSAATSSHQWAIGNTIVAELFDGGDLTLNGTLTATGGTNIPSTAQAGGRNLTAADNGTIIVTSNTSPISITIPTGLPDKFNCKVAQGSSGAVTVSGAGGTTVVGGTAGTAITANAGDIVEIYRTGTSTYLINLH